MAVKFHIFTFLLTCNEVFQEIDRERVVGRKVKLALNRDEIVTFTL